MLKTVFSTLALVTGAVRASDLVMPPRADNSTFGNIHQIRTSHVHLDLEVNFDTRQLSGDAHHTMDVVAPTSLV